MYMYMYTCKQYITYTHAPTDNVPSPELVPASPIYGGEEVGGGGCDHEQAACRIPSTGRTGPLLKSSGVGVWVWGMFVYVYMCVCVCGDHLK